MTTLIHKYCLLPERSDRIALYLHEKNRAIRYHDLASAVGALAGVLARQGIGRGARIALLAPPSFEFLLVLLAGSRLGAAVAPLDLSLRGLSLEDTLARLHPDAILGTSPLLARMPAEAAPVTVVWDPAVGVPPAFAGMIRREETTSSFTITPDTVSPDDGALETEGCSADDDALLIATSGSTGTSKFVRLRHGGTLFNIREHLASFGLSGPFRTLQVLGTNYSYGLIPSFLAPLTVGGSIILPARTDCSALHDAIEAHRPDVCLTTPALIEYLLDHADPDQQSALGRLAKLGVGGDACPDRLRRKIAARLPDVAPFVTYGATEAGPRIATLPPARFLSHPTSVGQPLNGVDVEVIDARDEVVDPGMPGRLRVLTPSRMAGYLGDPPSHGWFLTGDIASVDAEGNLTIHGRAGRAVKHRGRLLDPGHIEAVIDRFPGVIGSRVEIRPADDRLRAVVHLHPSHRSPDLSHHLRDHCRRNLPNRLVPHEIVTVAEEATYFFKGRSFRFSDPQS